MPTPDVAVVGASFSRIGRHLSTSIGALAIDAIVGAAGEAGIDVTQIDGLSVYPNPSRMGAGLTDGIDFVSASYVARILTLPNLTWSCTQLPGSFAGSVLQAVDALRAGRCTYAVAWRAMHNPVGRFGRYTSRTASGVEQFWAPYGLANWAMHYALLYSRYMGVFGATREHMGAFIVANRANAMRNPESIFHGRPVTLEEYMNDRPMADPLSYLDCDMPVDGAGAVLLTTADRAAESPHPAVYITGGASLGYDRGLSPTWTLEQYEEGARQLAKGLWNTSVGLRPKDIDLVNVYDGFSFFVYLWLEALGFCQRGEAFQYVQQGRVSPTGALPVNPNGGSLGMGRLHGPPQVIEAVRQLRGQAGATQIAKPAVAVVTTGSPLFGAGALLLTNAPRASFVQ